MLGRLGGHPFTDELRVGDAALLASLSLGVARQRRGYRVDREGVLVVHNAIDLARRPVRDVVGLEVGYHGLWISLQRVTVAAPGALRDHVELTFFGELEAHSHVVGR